MEAVKQELNCMKQLGVIAPVQEPTPWCSGMVVVPKANGQARICVDLNQLNKSVCRERYPLPAVEQILSQLACATVFSKLDANSGCWQILLAPESTLLTMFITPFGRYCFHRLPLASHLPQIFPASNGTNPKGSGWCCMSHGRCPDIWQNTRTA